MRRNLLMVVLSAGIATGASAQVVFDNFDAGDTYNTSSGWTVSGIYSVVATDWDAANGFISSISGPIDTIDLAIGHVTGSNEFTLALYDDAGGQPGSLLWMSAPIVGQMGSFGSANPPVTVNVGGAVSINAGQLYWVVASSADDAWLAWNLNSIGDLGPHRSSNDGGQTWAFGGDNDERGAFRVTLGGAGCPADLDGDGDADADDFFLYLDAFAQGNAAICDIDGDGDCDADDFFAYLDLFARGC